MGKNKREKVDLLQRFVFRNYNEGMGGVNLLDPAVIIIGKEMVMASLITHVECFHGQRMEAAFSG